MTQFTGSFNLQGSNVALAPSITSEDGTGVDPIDPPDPPTPPTPDDPGDDGHDFGIWAIIGIVAIGLFILFILICTIHYCYDQYINEEESQ